MPDDREAIFERIARELRQPVRLGSVFDARVMQAVRGLPRHTRLSLWGRLTMPRTITVMPLRWGVLAASLVLVAAYGAVRAIGELARLKSHGPAFVGAASQEQRVHRVQFVLVAPTARKVAVVGDFNGWDPSHAAYQARARGGGVWSVTAQLPMGHHRYSFVIDDSLWMADPTAPRAMDNDYGLPNSAIVVGEQDR